MRALLTALLLIASMGLPTASVAWRELGEDGAFTHYVDPDTLRGDLVRRTVWMLLNARSPDQRVQSMRMLLEADCREPRARVVSRTLHPLPMGQGAEIALPIASGSAWDYTRAGTANDAVRRFACAASESEMAAALERSSPGGRAVADRQARAPVAAGAAAGGPLSVPLQRQGGAFTVPVVVNDQVTLRFVVDSGAAHVNIPSDVVATLVGNGTLSRSDFLGRRNYVLADGSRITAETFRIRSMRIGDRVVEDVTGTVGRISSPFLLGQSFLQRLKSWSIDNANDAMILE